MRLFYLFALSELRLANYRIGQPLGAQALEQSILFLIFPGFRVDALFDCLDRLPLLTRHKCVKPGGNLADGGVDGDDWGSATDFNRLDQLVDHHFFGFGRWFTDHSWSATVWFTSSTVTVNGGVKAWDLEEFRFVNTAAHWCGDLFNRTAYLAPALHIAKGGQACAIIDFRSFDNFRVWNVDISVEIVRLQLVNLVLDHL